MRSGGGWSPRGVVANILDWHIIVSEFDFLSCYYVHFRTNALGKGMNSLIPLAMGWIVALLLFYKDDFHIK